MIKIFVCFLASLALSQLTLSQLYDSGVNLKDSLVIGALVV